LEHSGSILLRSGWAVRFFGIHSEGASNELVLPEAFGGRVCLWKYQSPGARQKLHFVLFTLAALAKALWHRPAWVYCSDTLSGPAAWLIRWLTPCRLVYHEHDSPVFDVRHPGSGFQKGLLWFRQRVGRQADLVILPNQKRLELFQAETRRRKPSVCVFNCPRRNEVCPENRSPRRDGILRLTFHGSINAARLPVSILEAMSQIPDRVRLSVAGYETVGAKGYVQEFLAAAQRLGLAPAVDFLGAMPHRGDILRVAAGSEIGLAFMPLAGGDVNMQHMAGASNKPFDYLACGLALLVSDRPEWNSMYVKPGYGLACDPAEPASIGRVLRWFLEHPEETRQMGERGRQRILSEWNYESQFDQVIKHLEGN
jgi:glycosyltransferase involved in cell wall biosynthesis